MTQVDEKRVLEFEVGAMAYGLVQKPIVVHLQGKTLLFLTRITVPTVMRTCLSRELGKAVEM